MPQGKHLSSNANMSAANDNAATAQDTHKKQAWYHNKRTRTVVLIASVAVVTVYFGGTFAFASRFYPNTTLQTHDISLKTADDVAHQLTNSYDSYQIQITGQGLSKTLKAADLKLTIATKAIANAAIKQQNQWLWPLAVWMPHKLSYQNQATFDKEALKKLLDPAIKKINNNATPSKSAVCVFDKEQQKFVIQKEVYGTMLDSEQVYKAVEKDIVALKPSSMLGNETLKKPDLLDNDPALLKVAETANGFLCGPIKLTFKGSEVTTINNDALAAWISFSGTKEPQFNTDGIATWMQKEFAGQLNTVGTTRNYTRPDGKAVKISGGTYGWKIDSEGLAKKLIEHIGAKSKDALEIPTKQTAAVWGAKGTADWGDTYLDTDLSEQYARLYVGGQLKWESAFVSGNIATKHGTPEGVYAINNFKSRKQTLTGRDEDKDGKPDYISFVEYWMPFVRNSIAFHDAPWRSGFGGKIYQSRGSHGCVNLPPAKAAELYNILPVGTPVLVHW